MLNQPSDRHVMPSLLWPWAMWWVAVLFVLLQFLLQLSSGAIANDLMSSFSLSALGVSALVSTYYYAYVVLQIPVGILFDRFGVRLLLSMAALVCALGCFLFSTTHLLWVAILGRVFMGAGASFAFVGAMDITAQYFPLHRFSTMVAGIEAVGMLGVVLGTSYVSLLVQQCGWRTVLFGVACLLVVTAGLIFFIVRSTPLSSRFSSKSIGVLHELSLLLKHSTMWMIALYSGLMFSVVTTFVALWGVPYMALFHHISLSFSTFLCDLVLIGVAMGAPFWGWLDRKVPHRRLILNLCANTTGLLLLLIIYSHAISMVTLMCMMFLLGIFCSVYIIPFTMATEIMPLHCRGSSLGFVNMVSVGVAPLLLPLLGLLIDLAHRFHGTVHRTVYDYQMGLLVLPLVLILSGMMTIWMPVKADPEAIQKTTEPSQA